jgi:hypothetical protein
MNTNDQPLKCTTNIVIKDTKAPRYIKPDSVKFLEALSFETTKNRFPNFISLSHVKTICFSIKIKIT